MLSVVMSLMVRRRGRGRTAIFAGQRIRRGPEPRDLFPEDGDGIVEDDVLVLQAIRQFVAAVRQRVDGSDHIGDDFPIHAAGPVRHAPHHADGPLPDGGFRRRNNPDDPFTMELGYFGAMAKRRKWNLDIGWSFEHARCGGIEMPPRRRVVAQFFEKLAYH